MRAFLLAAAVLLALPSPAQAQRAANPEAKAHFDRGLQHFADREYEAAIAELDAAYAIEPRPEFLFANAQAERLSGDCASAVVLYRRFLESDPPKVHADAARANLDRCETALSSRPLGEQVPEPAAPEVAPEVAPAPVIRPPPPPPPAETAWYADPWGGALLGTGLVALGVGGYFFAASGSDADSAATAGSYSEYQELAERAESRRTIALVGLGAGVGLVAGAALRYSLQGSRRAERVSAAVSVGPDLASLVLGGTF